MIRRIHATIIEHDGCSRPAKMKLSCGRAVEVIDIGRGVDEYILSREATMDFAKRRLKMKDPRISLEIELIWGYRYYVTA